jgi:hypothetical protein
MLLDDDTAQGNDGVEATTTLSFRPQGPSVVVAAS